MYLSDFLYPSSGVFGSSRITGQHGTPIQCLLPRPNAHTGSTKESSHAHEVSIGNEDKI